MGKWQLDLQWSKILPIKLAQGSIKPWTRSRPTRRRIERRERWKGASQNYIMNFSCLGTNSLQYFRLQAPLFFFVFLCVQYFIPAFIFRLENFFFSLNCNYFFENISSRTRWGIGIEKLLFSRRKRSHKLLHCTGVILYGVTCSVSVSVQTTSRKAAIEQLV